jgi:glutamate synthase (NADPH/NADH) small chain
MVKSLGVEFRQNVEIGRDISFEQLEKDYDAIFIGVGLGETWAMNIPGEDLEGVCGALEFIESTKSLPFSRVTVGRRVACIGAGNTAIDVVTAARRLGAEAVYLVYRRSEQEMPAFRYEFDLAKKDGVNFLWQTQPVRVLGSGGVVTGLECVRTRLGAPDERGKRSPETIPNSAFTIEVDMVVRAVGQKQSTDFLRAVNGIEIRKNGTVATDAQYRTRNPKYFAGGDCVNGGREVVDAVAEGMAAARGIDAWLGAAAVGQRREN